MLVGLALDRAEGEVVTCERTPAALLDSMLAAQRPDRPDAWMLLGDFDGNRRSKDTWRRATGLSLDLDWEDPTIPRDEGAHQPLPQRYGEIIMEALGEYRLSGFAYLTQRGLRVVHVLAEDITDASEYEGFAAAAGNRLLGHLAEAGVPLWREGRTGIRLDTACFAPWQPMRLPLPGQPYLQVGGNGGIDGTALEACSELRLDLDAALPASLAKVSRATAAWVQIALEVVVTGIMALASAAVGNTRWVVARGLSIPLSLQYLTCVPAGSGKGTVRGYVRRAAAAIERDIQERREEALRQEQDHADQLASWQADGRSEKKRKSRGPRPEPPERTGAGGKRVSYIVSEATLEGVIATMEDSPRGFLWASDEAHEIVGMLGRYGESGGARSLDAARIRRLMDSSPIEAHRARSNVSAVRRIPRPWLAIDADVQPGVLAQLFADEDRVSGLTARLLIHAPPPMQGSRRYVDAPPEPEPCVLELLKRTLEGLWTREQELEEGIPRYEPLYLDSEAERLWAEELERLERRYPGAGDEEAGALGHARGRLLRLAGVLALLRDAEAPSVTEIDMRRAIVQMRYHLAHHRALMAWGHDEAEAERLEKLHDQVQGLFEAQPETGVRPTDLRRYVCKKRYANEAGLRRAYADLHALGWVLRRRETQEGRAGRRPVPAFFPPSGRAGAHASARTPSRKSRKSASGGSGDLGDSSRGMSQHAIRNHTDARNLLDRASAQLIAGGDVQLPPPGKRVPCQICGSGDGFGVLPDDDTRWFCHSDKHKDGGCAVDLWLYRTLGRTPTPAEAVQEAKRILGENVHAERDPGTCPLNPINSPSLGSDSPAAGQSVADVGEQHELRADGYPGTCPVNPANASGGEVSAAVPGAASGADVGGQRELRAEGYPGTCPVNPANSIGGGER